MSTRADPFNIDLDAFQPSPKPKLPKRAIQTMSEAADFPSRAPKITAPPPHPPRRRRTGRNVQVNIKATQETIDRLTAISDAKGWAFGETLEHALAALQASLTR